MWSVRGFLGLVSLLVLPVTVFAQPNPNTSSGNAADFLINSVPVQSSINQPAGVNQRWWTTQPRVGRSYCVTVTPGDFDNQTFFDSDSVVAVFRSDATTLIVSNDDVGSEPGAIRSSRACWVHGAADTGQIFVRVTPFNATDNFTFRFRIVETTLFGNHFFIGGDYGAYTIIRNTTDAGVSATVTWRNLAGASVGSTNVVVPANGGVFLNARDFVNAAVTSSGNVQIAHPGSPQAIVATSTTLSATTGLSFDTIFFQRQ